MMNVRSAPRLRLTIIYVRICKPRSNYLPKYGSTRLTDLILFRIPMFPDVFFPILVSVEHDVIESLPEEVLHSLLYNRK